MKYLSHAFVILFLSLFSLSVNAESDIMIKKDIIKGNSELPKVMYIIPWQATVTETKFKGVQLDNYFESLLKPFHPHRVHLK